MTHAAPKTHFPMPGQGLDGLLPPVRGAEPRPRRGPRQTLRGIDPQRALETKAPELRAGFTLVEIILAIGLATGLLIVAMTFYRQAAEMRDQILRESSRVSTMRLVVDRLAGDLRAAQPNANPGNEFTGDSNSMSFVKEAFTSLPLFASPGTGDPSDLVRVSLTTLFTTNGTRVTVSGLDRGEAPLSSSGPALTLDTNAPPASFSLLMNSNSLSVYPPGETNQPVDPFAEIVRFVRFRYWDGAGWQSGWTNVSPPPGVEIVLSTVGLDADAEPDAYPTDAVRRVVFVPAGVPQTSLGPDSGLSTNSTIGSPTNSASL